MQSFWKSLPRPFFVLAPMEAVTDVVFRHVVKAAGAPDVFFTEFANATGWVHAGDKAIKGRLVKTVDERPLVAQIWGGEPGDMEAFARHCVELGFDGIDINMGCPAKSAVKSGGSALIRKPEVAIAAIAAAKTAGLPVSVKTRLGYTHVDEWHEWIATLLQQDISALTIHLRTKREMSKVPAHYELIPDIKKLRDELAPQTLLVINGDIRDRAHGLELVEKYGVDGVMIGRGVFQDPFCFKQGLRSSILDLRKSQDAVTRVTDGEAEAGHLLFESNLTSQGMSTRTSLRGEDCLTRCLQTTGSSAATKEARERVTLREESWTRGGEGGELQKKQALLTLLNYHLEMFDQYQPELQRPFETLKRFFKVYIRDFDGASDLRTALMLTNSTNEVRELLARYNKS